MTDPHSQTKTGFVERLHTTGDPLPGGAFDNALLGRDLALRFKGATSSAVIDNVVVERIDPPASAFLTLQVNTTSGAMSLEGGSMAGLNTFNYYQITSAGHSLNAGDWRSLEDQDDAAGGFPAGDGWGNGWEEAGGSGAQSLAEGYLTGDSVLSDGSTIALGAAYDEAVDARDLVLTYRTDAGLIFEGNVAYYSPLLGDMDNDGNVDIADLQALAANFGGGGDWSEGDLDGNTLVDIGDLQLLAGNFGTTSSLSASLALASLDAAKTPEPTTLALLGLGGLLALRRRE